MRVPWIRVHGGLYDKPVVDRLCHALRVREHEAIGVLVTFWSGVASHGNNGEIGSVSDAQLAKWAKLPGKRGGRFAEWVRAEHQDAEGRVPEWDDYAGALELRRAKERERLADKRQQLRNNLADVAQHRADVRKVLQPARANGTERYGTGPTEELPSRRRAKRPREASAELQPSWVQVLTDVWIDKVGNVTYPRVGKALKAIVGKHEVEDIVAAIAVYASDDEGPRNGVRKVEFFAEDFQRWLRIATSPLVDSTGVLTERGRRVGGA